MKIVLAEHSGFCWGVKRVILLAEKLISDQSKSVYSLGNIIHNSAVISKLQNDGLKIIDEAAIKNLPKNSTVLVRAHGITKNIINDLKISDLIIEDGTCPHVIKIQNEISKSYDKGYTLVILGDRGHAEIISLMSFCNNEGYVINSVEEVSKIPQNKKLFIVCQSTFSQKLFDDIVAEFQKLNYDITIKNTRCDATEKRQNATMELAKISDAMIVIGDKKSANTNRLFNLCKEINQNSFMIETVSQLDFDLIMKFETIGVSAGASTPDWLIEELLKTINIRAIKN